MLNPITTAPIRRAATAAKPSTAAAAAAPTPVVAKGAKKEAALPPRPEVTAKQKLAELAAQARREIGLSGTGAGIVHVGSKGDLSGLNSGPGGLSKAVGASAAPSAWGKPVAAEPAPINLQPPTLAQLPQLQQLLQQAANKKAAASRTVAAQAAASSLAAKPPPAVPQPVLNPPTPMWPALSSAASMPAQSGGQSGGQTPREGTTRPASPPTAAPGPTAWGPAASLATAASAPAPAPGPSAAAPGPQQSAGAAAAPTPSAKPSGTSAAPLQAPQSQHAAGSQAAAPVSKPTGQSAAVPSGSGAGQGTAEGASGFGSAAEAGAGGSAAAAAAGVAGTGAGPSRPAAAAVASAAVAEVPATGGTPSRQLVGAEYTDEEAREPKLTKAQRKNLKRAEKKKTPAGGDAGVEGEEGGSVQEGAEGQQRGRHLSPSGSGTSRGGTAGGAAGGSQHKRHGSDDPEQAQRAVQAEEAAVMEELCVNCIVARKVLTLMAQLQRLGVADFIAAAAIQRHGSNLLAALEWLLVAGADAASQPPHKVLAAAAESASASDVEIDIGQELQQLGDLQAAMGLPAELLQQCVLDCNGDVQTAATSAMDRMLRPQGGDGGGGDCAAAGDGRDRVSSSGSNSGTSAGGGQQGGGPGAGAGRQSDTQVSHFGVRLQDVPAEQGAAGSHRTASPSVPPGFGGLGGYGAGLLRGGLGGWQNGFLGDPMPLQELGLGAGAAEAAEAGAGGRSTSRLSHWLKEDPGRAAASPSACKANGPRAPNGLLGPQDPVLDSPFGVQQGSKHSDAPSLGTWLGSNGYHGGAGAAGGANGPTGLAPHGSYGNHSGFSFMTALSKPTLSMGGSQALGEGLQGEYGQYGQWGAQQPGSARLFAGASTGAGPAGEAEGGQQQGDNGEELSSIMALVNVR